MLIRSAGPDDLEAIAGIYVTNHRETYKGLLADEYFSKLTPERAGEKWAEYIQDDGKKIWVACEGDAVLGFAACRKDSEIADAWYIDSLHTASRARGRGIGTALIRTAREYASGNGYEKMSVCIVKGNEAARKLYTRLGAEHLKDFDDDFCGTVSHSEKLVWNDLDRCI